MYVSIWVPPLSVEALTVITAYTVLKGAHFKYRLMLSTLYHWVNVVVVSSAGRSKWLRYVGL